MKHLSSLINKSYKELNSTLSATVSYDNHVSGAITGTSFNLSYNSQTKTLSSTQTLTVNCGTKYMVDNLKLSNSSSTSSVEMNCKDKIMSGAVTITVTDVSPTEYTLTGITATNCTIVAKGEDDRTLTTNSTIYEGETITWTATAITGYCFDSDPNKMTKTGSYTVLGDYAISETANIATYTITYVETNCSITTKPTSVTYGHTVMYEDIVADSGYIITAQGQTATNASLEIFCAEHPEEGTIITPLGTGNITIYCTAEDDLYVHFSASNATITATGSESGTLSDGQSLIRGETITWSATADSGYTITSMTPTSPIENVQASKTLTVKTERSTPAVTITTYGYPNYMVKDGQREDYTVTVNPSSGWHVDDSITLTAITPTVHDDCMRFGKWARTVDSTTDYSYSTNNPLTDTIPSGSTITYVACYQLYISVKSENTSKGTVNISGQWMYPNYSQMRVVATPATGYNFAGWYDEDDVLWSTNADYTVETAHTVWPHDITAKFNYYVDKDATIDYDDTVTISIPDTPHGECENIQSTDVYDASARGDERILYTSKTEGTVTFSANSEVTSSDWVIFNIVYDTSSGTYSYFVKITGTDS